GQTHHIVVGQGTFRAQIGEGEQRSIASAHQFARALGQGDNTVGADIVRDAEAFSGTDINEVAVQLIGRRKSDGVHHNVETIPVLGEFGKNIGDFFVTGHITGKGQVGAILLCELLYA